MKPTLAALLAAALTVAISLLAPPANAAEAPRMTVDELRGKLGSPDVAVIDVRAWPDWASSTRKIKGSVREDPRTVEAWAPTYSKDRTLVLYCA